jgi:sugar O-acyltransferase (sialic acid O-acetyltransferase NeuD family)
MSESTKIKKTKKLIIVGAGEFAEIAYEYFTFDSEYEVMGFCVESDFLKQDRLYELPIIDLKTIEQKFPSNDYEVFVAITSTKLNRARTRLYQCVKNIGYRLASYISSKAFVWRNVEIGDNCFIFESNVIQHHAKIGNNVILWSGNHIGHRTHIEDNCFISSHVVISGYCNIGASCFVGVNATFADNISIGKDCLIGAGAIITRNIEAGMICKGSSSVPAKISSFQYFGIKE